MGFKVVSYLGSPYASIDEIIVHMGGFFVVRDASVGLEAGLLARVVVHLGLGVELTAELPPAH